MSDSDYEHWPEDGAMWQSFAFPVPGYDTNNGFKSQTYMPAVTAQPQIAQAYYPAMAYPQYLTYPAYAVTPAAYYGYPVAAQYPHAYVGRTKSQVDEDNSKVAARHGASGPHKVKPVAPGHQMFWVVEPDQKSKTLRTFMDIEELKGEWTHDAHNPDSWFFTCAPVGKHGSKKHRTLFF